MLTCETGAHGHVPISGLNSRLVSSAKDLFADDNVRSLVLPCFLSFSHLSHSSYFLNSPRPTQHAPAGVPGAFIWDVDVLFPPCFPFFLFLEMINCHGSSFQVSSPANNVLCEMGCILQEGKQTSYLKAETAILGPFVTVGESFISAKEVIWERVRVLLVRQQHPFPPCHDGRIRRASRSFRWCSRRARRTRGSCSSPGICRQSRPCGVCPCDVRLPPSGTQNLAMSLNLKSTPDRKMADFLGVVPNWVRLDSIRLIE